MFKRGIKIAFQVSILGTIKGLIAFFIAIFLTVVAYPLYSLVTTDMSGVNKATIVIIFWIVIFFLVYIIPIENLTRPSGQEVS